MRISKRGEKEILDVFGTTPIKMGYQLSTKGLSGLTGKKSVMSYLKVGSSKK